MRGLFVSWTVSYLQYSSYFKPTSFSHINSAVRLPSIDDIVAHKLKLNDDKTIIMEFFSPRMPSSLHSCHVRIGEELVETSQTARNLGVVMDQHFNMREHIKRACRAAYYHLRNIARIRNIIPQEKAEILVHAFIMGRLDYCNALLYGLPASAVSRLQSVQNSAARLVTRSRRSDHITPILRDLHWLPVRDRVTFKILLLTWRALHGLAPDYISQLVTPYVPRRSLRSAHGNLLVVPASRLRSFGGRSFAHAAPMLWNALPLRIRGAQSLSQFKKLLKTHLFIGAFDGRDEQF